MGRCRPPKPDDAHFGRMIDDAARQLKFFNAIGLGKANLHQDIAAAKHCFPRILECSSCRSKPSTSIFRRPGRLSESRTASRRRTGSSVVPR